MKNLINSLKYGSGNIISQDDRYTVVKLLNSWDTNYKMYDTEEGIVYLIDFDDVQLNEGELDKHGGILYKDLVNLEVDMIKEVSWKQETV